MHPVLFEFKNIVIHTYGFFIALGFLAAIFISKREARLVGEDPEKIADFIFWLLVAGIVGSRVFYVIIYWDNYYPGHLIDMVKIWEGGLVFYGGFLGAFIMSVVYIRTTKLKFWKSMDIITPAIPFGHFLGRLGCFSAGCCHGRACDLPWAVTFTNPESLAPLHAPLHPTQLYSSASNFLIFLFIFNYKRFKRFDGQVFWTYVIVYALARSILETFRGDFRGAEVLGILSVSQAVALVLSVASLAMLTYLYRRKN
ncbi:MAG: prolipoprotein diacylglyceryl transferase [Proteobacteria bacterium]|nr:prolipoprotein diacylglyceryl transferase [Pseudomonadota bacterium]